MNAESLNNLIALRETPLLWLFLTLILFRGFQILSMKFNSHPLSNPMVWTIVVLILILLGTNTPYEYYWNGGQYLYFLLGPATVALAVPLYLQLNRLGRAFLPLMTTLILGGLFAILLGSGMAYVFDLPREVILSIATRSVTTPISMGVAEQIGGTPQLAAAFVILTGVTASVLGLPLLKRLKLGNELILGFSSGIAGHGIATARIFQFSATAGSFAGLAMGLNGLFTAIIVPILLSFLRTIGIAI